jgi:hypothetical protein
VHLYDEFYSTLNGERDGDEDRREQCSWNRFYDGNSSANASQRTSKNDRPGASFTKQAKIGRLLPMVSRRMFKI